MVGKVGAGGRIPQPDLPASSQGLVYPDCAARDFGLGLNEAIVFLHQNRFEREHAIEIGGASLVLHLDQLDGAARCAHALLQKDRLEAQIREVRSLLGRRGRPGSSASASSESHSGSPRKRELSDAARKRIAAAQKKRWAEYRKQQKAEQG